MELLPMDWSSSHISNAIRGDDLYFVLVNPVFEAPTKQVRHGVVGCLRLPTG